MQTKNNQEGNSQKKAIEERTQKSLLDSLCHQLFSPSNGAWNVLKQRLQELQDLNRNKNAIGYCDHCCSLVSRNTRPQHQKMVINSIFSHHNMENLNQIQIAELFGEVSKRKQEQDGVVKVRFPGYDLPCTDVYFQFTELPPQKPALQVEVFQSRQLEPAKRDQKKQLSKRPPAVPAENGTPNKIQDGLNPSLAAKTQQKPPFKVPTYSKPCNPTPTKTQQLHRPNTLLLSTPTKASTQKSSANG